MCFSCHHICYFVCIIFRFLFIYESLLCYFCFIKHKSKVFNLVVPVIIKQAPLKDMLLDQDPRMRFTKQNIMSIKRFDFVLLYYTNLNNICWKNEVMKTR